MVMITRGGLGSGSGSRSGSSSGVEPIDERLHELITTDVIRGILDATQVIFGTVKEGGVAQVFLS